MVKKINQSISGYLHYSYAYSLSEFGSPLFLSNCKGWILKQNIKNTNYFDATGCYPIFCCLNWDYFLEDIDQLKNNLISVYMVLDPFGKYNKVELQRYFDVFIPFKHHFIINLKQQLKISKHHLRNIKKGHKYISVELCKSPYEHFNDWINLYSFLIKRHNIKGIAKFSEKSFKKLFKIPGIYIFKANYKDQVVGMTIWIIHNNIAYYHLGAYNILGYKLRASYALFDFAINFFPEIGIFCLNLGGGTGLEERENDGLIRFKQGWSNDVKISYFCGKILNKKVYAKLIDIFKAYKSNYFPAYRFI